MSGCPEFYCGTCGYEWGDYDYPSKCPRCFPPVYSIFPVQIPYLYNLDREDKYLMLDDINTGHTLCRRLGFEPNIIRVGKKEMVELKTLSHTGHGGECGKAYLSLPYKFEETNKESELTFICNHEYDSHKAYEEIMKKRKI